jgi:hypothetical protein
MKWVVLAGVLLAAPSLTTGLCADDWYHQLRAVGPALPGMAPRSLDLFTFADGNPAHARALADVGVFPWWADPEVKLAFFRPLTALTHDADHALWPHSPLLMHAHSLFWFALALVAAGAVFRRFLGPSLLALAFFALDDAHGPAVGWIANRNAMVALALGLPALLLHDLGWRGGWRPGRFLAPLSLAIGLCAGEAALAVMAYLVAWALVLDDDKGRFLRLWPYLLVVAVWNVAYRGMGYGAAHSGVYFDPVGDAGAFLHALPERASALLVGQLALPWSDFSPMYRYLGDRAALLMMGYSLALVGLLVWLFWPLVRQDRVARFFAVGLLLSTLPICATFPADRLLWFTGIGAMGLLARFFAQPRSGWRRWAGWALIGIHLVLAPPLALLRSRSMVTVEKPLALANDTIPKTPDIAHRTVVLLNPPSDWFAGYIQATRTARGETRPERLRWLAPGEGGVELLREDAFTLTVEAHGGFTGRLSEQMLRSPGRPLPPKIALAGVDIEVLAPDRARFRFDRSLDDPSFLWMRWGARGYQPASPPPVGGALHLPPVSALAATFAKR